MLLMFWLYINEQPGQGTLAKKATKWESHQYQSELCTVKVWMMLGERSLLHKGSNWNLFDVGWHPGPIRLLDFPVNCMFAGEGWAVVWYLQSRGTRSWPEGTQHTCGGRWGGQGIWRCWPFASAFNQRQQIFNIKLKRIVSPPCRLFLWKDFSWNSMLFF